MHTCDLNTRHQEGNGGTSFEFQRHAPTGLQVLERCLCVTVCLNVDECLSNMAGSVFSAGPVSLDMRWQPGPLQLMRVGTLAADLARLQTQAQWMQVRNLPLELAAALVTVSTITIHISVCYVKPPLSRI